jgi:hypothetical protein
MGLGDINYYTVNTSDEKFYLCKIEDSQEMFTVEQIEGVDTLTKVDFGDRKFIQLIDAFVVVQTPDGPIPVAYSKMPGGSSRLWVNVANIASFCVIDNGSKLVEALDQITSGIVTDVDSSAQASRTAGRR